MFFPELLKKVNCDYGTNLIHFNLFRRQACHTVNYVKRRDLLLQHFQKLTTNTLPLRFVSDFVKYTHFILEFNFQCCTCE